MHRDLIVVGEVRRGEACELTHAVNTAWACSSAVRGLESR
jgi:Flp pilus assembly CpaF family ATPase